MVVEKILKLYMFIVCIHCRMDKDQSFRKPEEENDYYQFEGKKSFYALTGEQLNFWDTCACILKISSRNKNGKITLANSCIVPKT